jgi:hypothetical protein
VHLTVCHMHTEFSKIHTIFLIYNQQDVTPLNLFFFNNAVHVSGGTSIHNQELRLYIQLLVFVKPCCYLLRSWLGWNSMELYVQSELLMMGEGSTRNM